MVGYGSSFRLARRPGWENCYVDYEGLKLILTQIEAVYEAAQLEQEEVEQHMQHSHGYGYGHGHGQSFSSWQYDVVANDATFLSYQYNNNNNYYYNNYNSFTFQQEDGVAVKPLVSAVDHGYANTAAATAAGAGESHFRHPYVRSNSEPYLERGRESREKRHIVRAHKQARQLAERFLGRLQSEVEKISLFSLARQGELADTIGSLRFGEQTLRGNTTLNDDRYSQHLQDASSAVATLDTISYTNDPHYLHPSASSSSNDDSEDNNKRANNTEHRYLRSPNSTAPTRRGVKSFSRSQRRNDFYHQLDSPPHSSNQPMFHRWDLIAGEDLMLSTGVDEADAYVNVGVELLHLLRYICINAMAVRKVLKKHDKLLLKCMLGQNENSDKYPPECVDETSLERKRLSGGADCHLQSLTNSISVDAIFESLQSALCEYQYEESRADTLKKSKVGMNTGFKLFKGSERSWKNTESFEPLNIRALSDTEYENNSKASSDYLSLPNLSLNRLEWTVMTISSLRDASKVVKTPFHAFFHRSAVMVAGQDLQGLHGSSREALDLLLRFHPDEILDRFLPSETPLTKARHHKPPSIDFSLPTHFRFDASEKFDWLTHYLNVMSSFLFTMNYYIVVPSAPEFVSYLGYHPSFAGTLIGVTAFAAIIATVIYSYIPLVSSCRSALLISAAFSATGNLVYSYAFSAKSIWLAIFGRFLVGFGCAESTNRQIIANSVPHFYVGFMSGIFILAGALGMSVGPLVASILYRKTGHDLEVDVNFFGCIVINNITSPAFGMSTLWLLYIFISALCFNEPKITKQVAKVERQNSDEAKEFSRSLSEMNVNIKTTYAVSDPFKGTDPYKIIPKHTDSNFQQKTKKKDFTFFADMFRLCNQVIQNAPLSITLGLLCFVQFTYEVLISSCPLVTKIYFGWNPDSAGFAIASLSILVLPAMVFVDRLSTPTSERKILKQCLMIIAVSSFCFVNLRPFLEVIWSILYMFIPHTQLGSPSNFGKIPYECYQYIAALTVTFMGTIILESALTGLMSKSTSPKLNKAYLNCGFIATIIGNIGRITGDVLILVVGSTHQSFGSDYINLLYSPIMITSLFGILIVRKYYNHLVI